MESFDNNWDEFLHDSLQYAVDTLGHPENINAFHAYDFELGSSFWGPQSRRNDPLPALGSIGALPPFLPHALKSSDSSPVLSDDYTYSADELRRSSRSTVSSEDTISPKDSMLFSPDLPEGMGYLSQTATSFNTPPSYNGTPGPMSPISPIPTVRPGHRLHVDIKPQTEANIPQAGPTRRRSAKATPTTSNNAPKSSAVSNNNNSKPMTARDRKRRQMHNASAMRSRIRLNETLDKMWKTIPVSRRRKRLSGNPDNCESHNDAMEDFDEDEEERIGRADKVEVGIDYIIYLEDRVRELEQQIGIRH